MTAQCNLSFIAQSLDNQKDDLIFDNGKQVPNGSEQARQVFDRIALMTNGNQPFFKDTRLKLYAKDKEILIEIIPLTQDIIERSSPIAIHGYLPEADESIKNWSLQIKDAVDEIIKNKAKRDIETKILDTLPDKLVKLVKKYYIKTEIIPIITDSLVSILLLVILQTFNLLNLDMEQTLKITGLLIISNLLSFLRKQPTLKNFLERQG